jgi:hypothetical protein
VNEFYLSDDVAYVFHVSFLVSYQGCYFLYYDLCDAQTEEIEREEFEFQVVLMQEEERESKTARLKHIALASRYTQVKSEPSLSPVECIYNTGSPNDEGYAQGYVDGNKDAREGNTYDNVLHNHHTQDYQTGYHDGYTAGFSDGKKGINKNPC